MKESYESTMVVRGKKKSTEPNRKIFMYILARDRHAERQLRIQRSCGTIPLTLGWLQSQESEIPVISPHALILDHDQG